MNNYIKFESYIEDFIEKNILLNKNDKYLLLLSGGVDSIVLFHLLLKWKKYKFEVLHFNHGTRPENKLEEEMVAKLCHQNQIQCHKIQLTLDLNLSNFEERARVARKAILADFIGKKYILLTAHHIDDSFEWSLMQSFRQGQLAHTIGIPLISTHYRRPLMCVSKSHILTYAKLKKLEWVEDRSNENIKFLRNYIRKILVPKIMARNPQYLKHYVYQATEKAKLYGLYHTIKKNELKKYNHFLGGVVLESENFEFYREEIINIVKKLSNQNRGKVNVILDQIFRSQNTQNETNKRCVGPWKFHGDVWIFLFGKFMWVTTEKFYNKFADIDTEMAALVQNGSHIPFDFVNNNSPEYFPNIFIKNSNKEFLKKNKLSLIFYQKSILELKKADIPYSFLALQT